MDNYVQIIGYGGVHRRYPEGEFNYRLFNVPRASNFFLIFMVEFQVVAATALDVLTLEAMKRELRISAGDDTQNERITDKIGEAVDYVSTMTGLPLIDFNETLYASPYSALKGTMILDAYDIREVTEIKFWETTQALREEPTGVVNVNTLGRLIGISETFSELLPPTDGWPARLHGSLFQVKVRRGVKLIAPGVKSAVILATRQLYEGFRDVRPTNAMHTFLRPHKRYL